MASSSNQSKLKSFRKCCITNTDLLHLLVTFGLFVLIWLIQVLHYPSFNFYEDNKFKEAMIFHQNRISFIVLPLMVLEIFITVWCFFEKINFSTITNLLIVMGIWLSTFFLQVPAHDKLILKKDSKMIQKLVKSNWIRTILWSLKLVVLLKQAYL